MDQPPASWAKAFPDEMLLNSDGTRYETPSLASVKYLAEVREFLHALVGYCEASSWAERIIGYVIYPLGEGTNPLTCEGHLFDRSPAMQRAFREHLRMRYGTDAALREAWQNPSASLETVEVPRDDDFRPVPFWPEAKLVRRERDYFEYQTPLFRRYLRTLLTAAREAGGPNRLYGLDALKGNMLGWMTHPIFSGAKWKTHYGDQFLAVGTTGMSEILDWPELDLVATPHDYRNRWIGYGFDPEGIGDSVVLHGKVMLVEEDQRSYANNERGLFGSIEPGEEEAILYRNLAATLTRGHQTYPMDVCVGYFQSDKIQEVLKHRREIEHRIVSTPRAEVPCVVMLVDDRSGLYTDFSAAYNDLAVIRQRIEGMNHCGVPTRTYLFDDLARPDFPACHKLFLLPNLFRADARTIALLHEKLFKGGNVIVFGPGSGITDGDRVAPDFATALTGIEFDLLSYEYPRFVTIDGFGHPLTAGFGFHDTFGDTHRYGPVLVPRGHAHTRLGTIALDNGKRRDGLVIKEYGRGAIGNGQPGPRGPGDYAVVFSAAIPLPARLLRNVARYSGTHVYCETDDVIFADGATVAIHATAPGPRSILLPRRCDVIDVVTGAAAGKSIDTIRFDVKDPITRWFSLQT
jgi:hypothetical protein